jgi:hypothetical protein
LSWKAPPRLAAASTQCRRYARQGSTSSLRSEVRALRGVGGQGRGDARRGTARAPPSSTGSGKRELPPRRPARDRARARAQARRARARRTSRFDPLHARRTASPTLLAGSGGSCTTRRSCARTSPAHTAHARCVVADGT